LGGLTLLCDILLHTHTHTHTHTNTFTHTHPAYTLQGFQNPCKFRKRKNSKDHIDRSIQTFTQLLVKEPLAAITALSLLGYDATSFAHLDLAILCHFCFTVGVVLG